LIASMNTRLQTAVRDSMRGRVMSFFNMAFMGALPLGQLVFGLATDRFGVARVLATGAVVALVGNFWLHRRARPAPALTPSVAG
jgi:predicted MFS family arabinose efflux permease